MQLTRGDRVLIVGATGLLGSSLCRTLAGMGIRPRCLVRSSSDLSTLSGLVAEGDLCRGDVRDPTSLEPHFQGVDVCFHLAGTVNMGRSHAELDELIFGGGGNVLGACRRSGVRKVIVVSTGETIGVCKTPGDACDEMRPFDPRNAEFYFGAPYHRLETLIGERVRDGLDVTIINLLYVMDAADKTGLFKRVLSGKQAVCIAGGISLSWIDDVMAAMVAAVGRGRPGERYMLAGENVTWRELFERIRLRAGHPGGVLTLPTVAARIVEALHLGPREIREMLSYAGAYLYYNCRKAQTELGYSVTPLDQIIDRVLAARRAVGVEPRRGRA